MQPEFRVIRFYGSLNNRYEAAQTRLSSFSFPTRSCTLWHSPPCRFFLSLLFIRASVAKSFYPFLHLLISSALLPSPVESVYSQQPPPLTIFISVPFSFKIEHGTLRTPAFFYFPPFIGFVAGASIKQLPVCRDSPLKSNDFSHHGNACRYAIVLSSIVARVMSVFNEKNDSYKLNVDTPRCISLLYLYGIRNRKCEWNGILRK